MRLLLQGHLDLPQRVTLDVVLKDPHPSQFRFLTPYGHTIRLESTSSGMAEAS